MKFELLKTFLSRTLKKSQILTMVSTMDASHARTAVTVVSVTLLYIIWRRIRRHLERVVPFEGIPMPPNSHWFWGHSLFSNDFRAVHQRMFYDYADEYGVCSFWIMGFKGMSVTQWQDAKAVLQSSFEHPTIQITRKHMDRFLGPRNMLTLTGKEWKFHRSAVLRVFHSSSSLLNSRAAMVDVTQTLVESLLRQHQPLLVDIEPIMKMITMDIFGRTALTHNFASCDNLKPSPMAKAFDYLGQDMVRRLRRPIWPPSNSFYCLPTRANRRHAYERQLVRSFLEQLIEERRQEKEEDRKPDLLTSLLRAHDEMKEQAPGEVTDQTLVDIMMSLLFAGYDTTSITLTYALYVLSTNPEVEQRCLEEIERVLKEDGGLTNPDRLVYCQGVVTETLRMYPPAFVTNRKMTKPLKLSGGFVVAEGTSIIIPIYMIQHDPKHFSRPEEFLPERWVMQKADDVWVDRDIFDESNSNVPAGNRDAFFAFSAGARSCAAQKFALQEAVLVMAILIKELKFTAPPDYVPVPKRNGIVQTPQGGMPMTIAPRNKSNV